jgi:sugar diacid utilization regulator
MARAHSLETGVNEGDVRGAATAAPRFTTPLKLVEAAVAGDDLQSVARAAATALSCTVAIALPALGLSAQWPGKGVSTGPAESLVAVHEYAAALVSNNDQAAPPELRVVAPVRLGRQVVGVVAALAPEPATDEARTWLDAAAAAAAVAALMRESSGSDLEQARRAFLQMVELQSGTDPDALLAQARRLGYDFSGGLLAIGAALDERHHVDVDAAAALGLVAEVGERRLLGLVPLGEEAGESGASALLSQLQAAGLPAIASAPRRGPDGIKDALQEAAVLLELLIDDSNLKAHEDTYRLLVGVLARSPDELAQLRDRTIAPIESYDVAHDTDLLATLETFLNLHGSTTDTAEAMKLHRHTVGYRLARVQEVSGLSPYESEGRERLSLGLKAHRIMVADTRRAQRSRQA